MKPAQDSGGNSTGNQYKILVTLIIALVLIILMLLFNPPLPSPPQGSKLVDKAGLERQTLKSTEGVVLSFRFNDHQDINSMQIKSASLGIISIDFRPHTARTVMRIAKIGDTITIKYTLHPTDEIAGYQLYELTNQKTKEESKLTDIPPPRDIPEQTAEKFTLDNPELITDPYGGIVAIRKNNLLFHFKPGLVDDLLPLIKANHHFIVIAVKRTDELGFVNVKHNKVYIVLSITIDHKTFLVR